MYPMTKAYWQRFQNVLSERIRTGYLDALWEMDIYHDPRTDTWETKTGHTVPSHVVAYLVGVTELELSEYQRGMVQLWKQR